MNGSIGFTIFNTFNVLVKLCVDKFVHLICINLAVLLINIVQLRDICSHRVYVSTPKDYCVHGEIMSASGSKAKLECS